MSDLISRDALVKCMSERWRTLVALNGEYDHYTAGFDDAISYVDDAPAVEAVEVVHGKWEGCWEDWRHQLEGNKCSVCGFEYFGNLFKYCPNCCAKMDGGAK